MYKNYNITRFYQISIVKEQCIVQFPYTALNEDELSLAEGQIVTIISKEVEDKVKNLWKMKLHDTFGEVL